MVMLHKFASLSPRPDFSVVTVNHSIRPQAQADCDFVKDYCKQLNVECRVVSVDVPSYSKQRKLSEETAARILRYQALDGIQCDYVCLAHHMGDNVETVLMHILRGSGAQGACGIRAQNGKYIRPLLDMTREQIEQYAKQYNVPFVHDYTNDETKYTRNFVRHNVLPLLKQLNSNAEQNIARFAENISEDCDYLDSLTDITTVDFGADYARIPVALLQQPKPIALRTINKVFNGLGVFKDIERTHIESIIDLAFGVGGRQVDLPFGYVAVSDYDFVTIEQTSEVQTENFEIPFSVGKTPTPVGIVEVSQTPRDNALRFDLGKLPSGCVFRLRKQGDVFTKFGGGTKPLKKYLIDKKIPQRQRDSLLLIADNNEVYAICGVEISDKIKTEEKPNVYYITVSGRKTDEAL